MFHPYSPHLSSSEVDPYRPRFSDCFVNPNFYHYLFSTCTYCKRLDCPRDFCFYYHVCKGCSTIKDKDSSDCIRCKKTLYQCKEKRIIFSVSHFIQLFFLKCARFFVYCEVQCIKGVLMEF